MTTEVLKRLRLTKCLNCHCLCFHSGVGVVKDSAYYCAYNEIPDSCEHYWKRGDWEAWENREGETVQ